MSLAELLLWLAKLFGGEAIKARLSRSGTRAELRVLKRALQDSQERRDELEGAAAVRGCGEHLIACPRSSRASIEPVEMRRREAVSRHVVSASLDGCSRRAGQGAPQD